MHKQRNHSFDVLKLLCALLVCILHTGNAPFNIFEPITRIAVPIFFMISGFYLFSVDKEIMSSRLQKSTYKIIKIFCWSTIFWGINDLYKIIFVNGFSSYSVFNWYDIFIFNENPVAFHLWYISAYIYVLIFFLFLNKYGKFNSLYIITIFILLLTVPLFSKYCKLIWGQPINELYIRNWLFTGIPYFGLGTIISKYKNILLFKNLWLWSFFTIVFAISSLIERNSFNVEHDANLYLSTPLLAFSVFILFRIINTNQNILSKWGEKYSLYIYIFHPLFMRLLESQYVQGFFCIKYTIGFIVFVLTIIFCMTLLSYKSLFNYIKKLIIKHNE